MDTPIPPPTRTPPARGTALPALAAATPPGPRPRDAPIRHATRWPCRLLRRAGAPAALDAEAGRPAGRRRAVQVEIGQEDDAIGEIDLPAPVDIQEGLVPGVGDRRPAGKGRARPFEEQVQEAEPVREAEPPVLVQVARQLEPGGGRLGVVPPRRAAQLGAAAPLGGVAPELPGAAGVFDAERVAAAGGIGDPG